MLWLLASEDKDPTSGEINDSPKKISFRLRLPEKDIVSGIKEITDAGFIEGDSACNEIVTEFREIVTPETETETHTEAETETELMCDYRHPEDMFPLFWDVYNKKVGDKDKVKKKFLTLINSEVVEFNYLMESVAEYVASTPEKKYRKDPATYLNNKSWNDEIIYKSAFAKPTTTDHVNAIIGRIENENPF
tara:strand:- start:213 stop:785 length:573 start_codon:yes stop_codon:yes gene_type:complete